MSKYAKMRKAIMNSLDPQNIAKINPKEFVRYTRNQTYSKKLYQISKKNSGSPLGSE